MNSGNWVIGACVGGAAGVAVASTMTLLEWRLNPGGIFHLGDKTDWAIVQETALSWFVPVAATCSHGSFFTCYRAGDERGFPPVCEIFASIPFFRRNIFRPNTRARLQRGASLRSLAAWRKSRRRLVLKMLFKRLADPVHSLTGFLQIVVTHYRRHRLDDLVLPLEGKTNQLSTSRGQAQALVARIGRIAVALYKAARLQLFEQRRHVTFHDEQLFGELILGDAALVPDRHEDLMLRQ